MENIFFTLDQLNDRDVDWLLGIGQKELIRTGNILIREAEPIDSVYVVMSGAFSVLVAALGNREIARLGCGEIVGEMSLVDGGPPSATVKALENSVVFAMPKSELTHKLEQDPGFTGRFYKAISISLSNRLRNTMDTSAKLQGSET